METTGYRLRVEFITPLLGSQPTREIATKFIAQKRGFALPSDEAESLPDALDEETTVFHKDGKGRPVLWDYQVRGFLKEAGAALNGKVAGGVKNLRAKVERTVFVAPRTTRLYLPERKREECESPTLYADAIDYFERPVRIRTPHGESVSLKRSEMLPEGTWLVVGLTVFPGEISTAVLEDLLDYGLFLGIGQFRTGGYGRFRYELREEQG